MRGSSYLCSKISGGAENAIPLYEDIPRTGGIGSYLPSEAVRQEHLQFPYEYFPLVLPFEGYCSKLSLSNNPKKKNITRIKIRLT
jgi:hypothetical protein